MEENLLYLWIMLTGLGSLVPALLAVTLLIVVKRRIELAPFRYIAYFLLSIALEILIADLRAQFFVNHTYFMSTSISIGIVGRVQEIITGIITLIRLLQFFFNQS